MAVGGHGNQVTPLPFGGGQNLFGRIAPGQNRMRVESLGTQLEFTGRQILPIATHLFGFAEVFLITRHEAIGDVDEGQSRLGQARQWADMGEDYLIGGGIVERYQNVAVHLVYPPRRSCQPCNARLAQ
ncbi:MAG: hypothetical protein HY304_01890 [candidate division Zixibacteria bacterium]|nr:hypothetical protein [candidate division Zixibacteria bacterium]